MNGYRTIFETLRKEVLDGKYNDTTVLPSEWALARRFGVCRPTVSRAILEMVNAGLVVRRQGASTTLTRFAKNASGTIGILTQGEWNYEDLYPSIVRGVRSFAERSGWRVIRCGLEPSSGRRRVKAIREVVERLIRMEDGRDAVCDVSVADESGRHETVRGVRVDAGFDRPNWIGYISTGKKERSYWIDNLSFCGECDQRWLKIT